MKCFIWIRVLYKISNIYDTFIIYILFLQKKFAVKVPCEIFHVIHFIWQKVPYIHAILIYIAAVSYVILPRCSIRVCSAVPYTHSERPIFVLCTLTRFIQTHITGKSISNCVRQYMYKYWGTDSKLRSRHFQSK